MNDSFTPQQSPQTLALWVTPLPDQGLTLRPLVRQPCQVFISFLPERVGHNSFKYVKDFTISTNPQRCSDQKGCELSLSHFSSSLMRKPKDREGQDLPTSSSLTSQSQHVHPEPSLSLPANPIIQPVFSQWLLLPFIFHLFFKARLLPWTPSLVPLLELEPLSPLFHPCLIYSMCHFLLFYLSVSWEDWIYFSTRTVSHTLLYFPVQQAALYPVLLEKSLCLSDWKQKQFPQPRKQAELVLKPKTPDSCSHFLLNFIQLVIFQSLTKLCSMLLFLGIRGCFLSDFFPLFIRFADLLYSSFGNNTALHSRWIYSLNKRF